ncbi:MAG: hypothetical protein HQ519_05555 [Planctomycetes bacterium]|nr:hypothetical protein [Planctomycetota bacterium]
MNLSGIFLPALLGLTLFFPAATLSAQERDTSGNPREGSDFEHGILLLGWLA